MTNNSLFVSFQMYFTYMFLFIIFFVWNGIEVMEVHNCDIYFSPAGIVRCIYYMLWHKRYPHEDLYLLLVPTEARRIERIVGYLQTDNISDPYASAKS